MDGKKAKRQSVGRIGRWKGMGETLLEMMMSGWWHWLPDCLAG